MSFIVTPKGAIEGSISTSGQKVVRTYTQRWLVNTWPMVANQVTVLEDDAIPDIYGVCPVNPDAKATSVSASPSSPTSKYLWEVTATYSTDIDAPDTEEDPEDPLARPLEISWEGFEFDETITREEDNETDSDRTIIKTTNGEPVVDGITRKGGATNLVIVKNYLASAWSADFYENYSGKVNSDTFYGKGPGHWLMGWPSATRFKEGDNLYFSVRFTIYYKSDGWQFKAVQKGTYYLEGGDADQKKDFINANMQNYTWYLKENGDKADNPDDAYVKEYKIYKEVAFAPIGLGG